MICIKYLTHLTCLGALLWAAPSQSEDIQTRPLIRWAMSAGMNQYTEPHLMRLEGPEVGLHMRITQWPVIPNIQLEGDVLLGKQKYTSQGSGSKNGVTNLETRWRGMWPVFKDENGQARFLMGLAFHTLWNDLRGTTEYEGVTYGGYQRIAGQLWLPMRWAIDDRWSFDTGLLIYGRHTSRLSEVSPLYSDIVNTQHSGEYAQVSLQLPQFDGGTLKPFLRYTHLADSNKIIMSNRYWWEPESVRWQAGVTWEFNPL